jgi:hypothetical protein
MLVVRGRTQDRLRVAAHYIRDGLLIVRQAASEGFAVAWHQLGIGLTGARDRLGPALAWARCNIRIGLATTGHALRRGLAEAWDQLRIGLARAPGALRYGLTAASAQLLPGARRVWNGRRPGTPRGSEPPAPARNPLHLDRAQLRVMLAVAAILAMAAVSLLGYGLWARWSGTLADQVAALNLTLALGTLVALLVAGLIALVAHRRAAERPDLSFEIEFPFSEPNRPQLMVDTSHRRPDGFPYLAHFEQVRAKARIANRTPFAARHPACRIELIGLHGRDFGPGWTAVIANPEAEPTVIQWDGGADCVIHGEWERVLDLDFRSVVHLANGPAKMVAHVVADGAPAKVCEIPMDLLQPRDWLSRHPEWSRPVPLRDASAVTVDDLRPGETPSLTVSE